MEHVIDELRIILDVQTPRIQEIPDEIFSAKPLPHKWSKKQVIGHLIDSAQNNLRRFVCGQYEAEPPRITYQQDFWVEANDYERASKNDLILLWRLLNRRICAVLEKMPPENYTKQCDSGQLHTLEWLAEDYIRHTKHHINQIIAGSFDIVYKST